MAISNQKGVNFMYPAKIDVAVLIIFFVREKQLKLVFDEVKKARPTKLYLYQDGPRENRPDDNNKILRCREIVSDIDWECEVHTFFQDKNKGCDPSGHIAHNWMLNDAGMGIILEDDTIPSQSFFIFCKELLERYKDDNRIRRICGMNNREFSPNIDGSYFFSRKGSIWGWASWKRTIRDQDTSFSFLDNPYYYKNLEINYYNAFEYKELIKLIKKRRSSGVDYFESIERTAQDLNYQINIVPKYNMITNCGIDEENTHSTSDIRKLPKSVRRLFNMKRYEIEEELKHPQFVIPNKEYDDLQKKTRFKQIVFLIEKIFLRILYH